MDKLLALVNRCEGAASALIRYRAEMRDALHESGDLDPSAIDRWTIQAEAALMGLNNAVMPWLVLMKEIKGCTGTGDEDE